MPRKSRAQVLDDIHIHGDELEQDRIQLERTLQHNNHSRFQDDEYSVEYPRHNSGPLSEHGSFIRRPGTDFYEGDIHNAWSYRTGDDDEGLYVGQTTMSTAAHHASAVTLSAGLGRGRAARRDISLSGAEFDPDRPLDRIIGGADSKLSMFDMDPSRSRYTPAFDPVIVDDTDELDRVLQSGYAKQSSQRSVRVLSHHSSSTSSSSSSDSESPSHPKLADALRRVSFSPKRPRTASPRAKSATLPEHHHSTLRSNRAPSPLIQHNRSLFEDNEPTPRPAKRSGLSNATNSSFHPEVRLQPPTPSTSGSKKSHTHKSESSRATASHRADDNPFHDGPSRTEPPTARRGTQGAPRQPSINVSNSRSRLHLPDMTGLTSVVASPARAIQDRYAYEHDGETRQAAAQVISTMAEIQARLHGLENENSISRRRVRELEQELEICKREVVRERTRVLEREDLILPQRSPANAKKGKGKERATEALADTTLRYKEVVEEKKALEALITSLRSHLSRLTAELSSHQALLMDLKSMREMDARTMREKSTEVDRLRQEVERLAGEVEVLKGVVEEGLKERRSARELSRDASELEYVTFDEGVQDAANQTQIQDSPEADQEDEEPEAFDPASIPGSSREHAGYPNQTIRTDYATIGSRGASPPVIPPLSERFIDDEEVDRISAEMEERRSERSGGGSPPQTPSYFNSGEHSREEIDTATRRRRPAAEDIEEDEQQWASFSRRRRQDAPRPSAPTPAHASSRHRQQDVASDSEAPVPHIRGARMERLFHTAEHDAQSCTMCRRRGRRPGGRPAENGGRPLSPSWLPSRLARTGSHDDDDEGFVEGSESVEEEEREAYLREARNRKKHGGHRTPPQAVLARVIREMEQDFGHYKSVYSELADQYKLVDAVSDVPKRRVVAQHLREVIDIIEEKADQIDSLYNLVRSTR